MEIIKRNILFVAQVPIDPFKGGVQNVTTILANEMRSRGHNVYFLCLSKRKKDSDNINNQYYLGDEKKQSSAENINITRNLIEQLNVTHIINQAGIYSNIMSFFKSLNLKHIPIYTVHHNCLKCLNIRYREIRLSNNSLSTKILKLVDFKLVWSILKLMNRIKYSILLKNSIKQSDKLVLLSKEYIPELEYYWINEKYFSKVEAVYNPFSIENEFDLIGNKEKRIIFVGRLEFAQKRVDRLLHIWHSIHKNHPDWSFDVIGYGEKRQYMEEYVKSNNLNNISFHGKCDPKPFLAKASIFTLVSDFEGWPTVITEALSFNVIPLAFNSFSSIQELINHDENGFIVQAFEVEDYIKTLDKIIKNESKRNNMAKKTKESLEKYTPSKVVQRWEELFNK